MLQSINIICHKAISFFRHQNNHLHSTIQHQWTSQQHALLQNTKDDGLIIGGDARCDSMRHSAKCGSYTAVDLERKKILNVELVQSNQVKSSYHKELQGLQQMFQLFEQFQVTVKALITDRHRQIAAWVRKNLTTVKHYFDCWHIAKSIKKKLKALAKNKGCELVSDWIRSIVNHYYWSVMSTDLENKGLIEAKWKSLLRHIKNIHSGHGDLYPECSHSPLTAKDQK